MKKIKTILWIVIAISVISLLISGVIRLINLTIDPPPTNIFDKRYVEHPWVTLLHIVPGLLFLTLVPFQFVARIRQRHINIHRIIGRILVVCAFITGVFALIAAFRFPAYGGVSTQAATLFFSLIFLFSLIKAVYHIRKKEVHLHREWMIRTVALAMGVASIRIFVLILMALTNFGHEEVFGTSFWLGFSVNLLVAEVWINYTRKPVRNDSSDAYEKS